MTPTNFTIWLDGYLAGVSDDHWSDELESIREKLTSVDERSAEYLTQASSNCQCKPKDILHD